MVGFSNATTCALILHLVFFFYLPAPAVSLFFDYPTFTQVYRNGIKIEGDAVFEPDGGMIAMIKNNSSNGRVSYGAQPMQLWDNVTGEVASFTTRFMFTMYGSYMAKGGMAFFLTGYPSRLPAHCPDYNLGLTNQSAHAVASGDSRFVAVEFDIFKDALVSDPDVSYHHVGIDINSLISVSTYPLPKSTLTDIRALTATIEYDNVSSILEVALWDEYNQSYNLSSKVDFKNALPEQVSIGFSASASTSGDTLTYISLISWSFNSSLELRSTPPPSSGGRNHSRPRQPLGHCRTLLQYTPDPTPPVLTSPLLPPSQYTPDPTPPVLLPPPQYTPDPMPPVLTPPLPPPPQYTPDPTPPVLTPPLPPPPQYTPDHPVSWGLTPPLPPPPPYSPLGPGHGVIAGAAVGATMFLVLLFAAAAALLIRRRRQNIMETEENYTDSEGEDGPMTEIEMGTGPRRFPYHELVDATRNFAAEKKLGQGGFGAVYQGYLREPAGLAVAVKRLQSSIQGKREYKSEIKVISRLRHRNLVQLIGWCHGHDKELLLVYELMPNRSLDIHLHGKQGTFLTWPMRMKILLELGSALLYLHEEWEQRVLHRDIKPSNVMLDESFGAKLGDFGLARLVDHTAGMQTMTVISGTPGYLDPECVNTGRASAESDMYSFGVVLLEVACGRRPMSISAANQDKQMNGGAFRLVEWVWGLYGQGAILEAADERLNGDYNAAEVERVMVVGLWCAHPNPSARPSIRTAMATLQPKVNQACYQLPVLPSKMPVPMYEPSPPLAWANVVGMSSSSSHTIGMSSSTLSSMPPHTSITTSSDAST